MTAPWIEIEENPNLDIPAGPGSSEYTWQGMFACQVEILPHQEWAKLKWGFNAAALFEEALERQKLFLESQYGVRQDAIVESPDSRTLAFRLIHRPGEGLSVAVLGKIHGRTKAEALESALSYHNELKSTFPYDYTLVPALSRPEFLQVCGIDLLDGTGGQIDLAQIKRLELSMFPEHNSPVLQGVWRSGPRSHEPIWRSLAASSVPLLLNMSLRCTVLYDNERERLFEIGAEVASIRDVSGAQNTIPALQSWNKNYLERRLAPWKKLFYLQIHLASTRKLSEHMVRTIGTSLTLGDEDTSLPGYKIIYPRPQETQAWQKKLKGLNLILSGSLLPIPRLSEMADLEEVFAVMRLPYSPPENGFPDIRFKSSRHP